MKINLHTHTLWCDGNNSVEDNALAAIERGFDVLGFSGHSMHPFAGSWHIAPRDFADYEAEVLKIREKYKDKIQILLGYEADYFPGVTVPSKAAYKARGLNPDYLIGSVHYVLSERGHYTVDSYVERVRENLIRLYGKENHGMEAVDGRLAVCEYFSAQREMLAKGDFEILGHADVIRKRNGILNFFDESETWYADELKATADAAAKAGVIVEINSGGIARQALDDFYPSEQFLALLFERKVPVLVSSDSHSTDTLDFAFGRAVAQAKKIGYKELVYPLGGRTVAVKI